mgnify:FL=1
MWYMFCMYETSDCNVTGNIQSNILYGQCDFPLRDAKGCVVSDMSIARDFMVYF